MQWCSGRHQDLSSRFPQPYPLPGVPPEVRDSDPWGHSQGIHGWQESSWENGKQEIYTVSTSEWCWLVSVRLLIVAFCHKGALPSAISQALFLYKANILPSVALSKLAGTHPACSCASDGTFFFFFFFFFIYFFFFFIIKFTELSVTEIAYNFLKYRWRPWIWTPPLIALVTPKCFSVLVCWLNLRKRETSNWQRSSSTSSQCAVATWEESEYAFYLKLFLQTHTYAMLLSPGVHAQFVNAVVINQSVYEVCVC